MFILLLFYQYIYFSLTGLQAPLTFSKTDFVFEIPLYDLDTKNNINNRRSEVCVYRELMQFITFYYNV